MKRYFLLLLAVCGFSFGMYAQSIAPKVKFVRYNESSKTTEDVMVEEGKSEIGDAPLEITCIANVNDGGGKYNYMCEWKIYRSDKGEESTFLVRTDEEFTYTLTESGGYGIKLYVTFVDEKGDTVELHTEQPISVVVSESKLICPDGVSPNDDNLNDKLIIEYKSLVKASGVIVNRWGKKLHTFTLENLKDGWDAKQNGKPVKDGAYFLYLDAVGSDGLHYKIRKTISVLSGYNQTADDNGASANE